MNSSNGEMLFDPDVYKGRGLVLTIDSHNLSEDRKLDLGRRVTELRLSFTEKANKLKTSLSL